MEVFYVGYNWSHPKDFVEKKPKGGEYIYTLIITRSPAYFVVNGVRKELPPNSAILYRKETPQIYGALNEEYIDDWLHILMSKEEEEKIKELGIPFDEIFSVYNVFEISGLIRRMCNEYFSVNVYKKKSLNLYLELVLNKLSESLLCSKMQKESEYYPIFLNIRNKIYLNPKEDWSVESVCKEVNLSRSYVQHMYKLFFDCSIISDIKMSRIEHAKYLLVVTEDSIALIAERSGYNSIVHFIRTFKETEGVTPTQYRLQLRLKREELRMVSWEEVVK